MSAQDSLIGRSFPRQDGPAKVRGQQRYAADFYAPDMLWAGVKRAGVPHARLLGLETGTARQVPGVVVVLSHQDVKGSNRQGVIQKDQPVLVDDKVRHCGDAVALVVAQDPQALKRGLELIELRLEPLAGVFDPEQALDPQAPLVHQDHPNGNLLLGAELKQGQGRAALAQCPVQVQAVFDLPRQEHAYLETEAGWARLEPDGGLLIVASSQTPFRDRLEVAEALGLDPEHVRVKAPYCGGAFGGKDGITVQSLLALAALACPGRPVKMWLSRQESFLAGAKRHPARLYYHLGAQADGALHALSARLVYDTGPYDHLGGVVMTLGLEHAGGPYRIDHVSLQAQAVYTNNPVSGPFRGFGVPQAAAALEQAMDMLALELAMDPLELRRRNLVQAGQESPAGVKLVDPQGLGRCLDALASHPLWTGQEKWLAEAGPFKKRGVGMACVLHGMGYGPVVPDVAQAKLELSEQGTLRLYCGVVDMGQGNASTYAQIAAELLGQDPANLELIQPDTGQCLPSGSASASRTTYTFGNALIQAASELRGRLLARAAETLGSVPVAELALAPGLVRHRPSGQRLDLAQLAAMLEPAHRLVTARFQAPTALEPEQADPVLGLHGFPHLIYSYGAHLALVEVDQLTGQVQVQSYLATTECGRVINPQVLEQQVQGAVAQGLGYALLEDFACQQGQAQTRDLSTYLIPTALDLPEIESIAVQGNESSGPFGLKGAGEVATDGPAPAVANAVARALGVRLTRLPLTPQRVLRALEQAQGQGCGA